MADASGACSSSMAGSASTSYSQYYDVFINHRGPDVKDTFATRLYRSLHSYGLQVFLDKPEMQLGRDIPSQIKDAIRAASVQVAIFSPTYAKSPWCLDELVLMVDSVKSRRATILPVFYRVNPSDLRWTGKDKSGPYAVALREYEEKQRYDIQTIEKWKRALLDVANISGLELEAFHGGEEELLDKVVQGVRKVMPRPQLDVAKYPTGLEDKSKEFETNVLLQQGQDRMGAKVVGIVGSGGVGKTTLAKYFFNSKRSDYDGSCFLFDVRENAVQKNLNSLQSRLIKDLKHRDIKIERCEEGIEILKKFVSSSKALIILDDVDNVDQLNVFLPIKDVLDPDSLILVTSRDKSLLIKTNISESSVYSLTGLNSSHSRELFCKHAFFEPHPLPGYGDLVHRFVEATYGLPLSLKVFGALVCGEDEPYWKEQLDALEQKNNKLPEEIEKSLEISYDSLSDEEKQIFLDIACFSIGEDRDKWIRIWGGSRWKGLAGFRNLQNKCLVEVGSENEIRMHDHLRDLGRYIAKGSKPLRLPAATTEDLLELLCAGISTEVRGIRMAAESTLENIKSKSKMILDKSASHRMFKFSKLQLLEAEGDFVESILACVKSPNLIWLRWSECPFTSLPFSLPLVDLRVLEVAGSKLEILWQSPFKAPMQLRELNINAPLLKFPDLLGQLEHLEKLVAEETNLGSLPENFWYLRSLEYLKLKDYKMQILPSCGGKVTNLQLSQLIGLQNRPDSTGNLSNLQITDLQQCKSLEMLLTVVAWRRSRIPPGNY